MSKQVTNCCLANFTEPGWPESDFCSKCGEHSSPDKMKRWWLLTKDGEVVARDYEGETEDDVWEQISLRESCPPLRAPRIKHMKANGFTVEEMPDE